MLPPHPWFPIILLVYFPYLRFSIISCTSFKISEYLALLSPLKMTYSYKCLLFILLLPMTMPLNYWCFFILHCDGFQYSQCKYCSLTRLVTSTLILVSSCHAWFYAFFWRTCLVFSVFAVIFFIIVGKLKYNNAVLDLKFEYLWPWPRCTDLDLLSYFSICWSANNWY